jgi:hypothetical protein
LIWYSLHQCMYQLEEYFFEKLVLSIISMTAVGGQRSKIILHQSYVMYFLHCELHRLIQYVGVIT